DIINEHIHNWHKKIVLKNIAKKKNMRVLDIGCGYGRLSMPVIDEYPETEVLGIDITETFVKFYQEMTKQKAILGTLESIPDEIGQFDYILCVTVLMYSPEKNVLKSLQNLIKHLKPEGKLILIEPQASNMSISRLFGIGNLIKKFLNKTGVDTGGRFFKRNEIENYIKAFDGTLESKSGLPFTTFCILPLNVIARICPRLVTIFILNMASWFDNKLGLSGLPSLHYAYIIKK
ncbi:MAG: class I SAM-dependent methyltransferase, partial [Chitinivibrionales bacterium]